MNNIKTGLLIRELRKEKGLTQKNLAEQLHITDRAVSKWERGLCAPDLATLEPLAKLLDISVSELIIGERMAVQTSAESLEKTVKEVIAYSENEIVKKTRILKIKWAITACIIFLMMLAAFVVAKNNIHLSIGTCIVADNGRYLVVLDNSPVAMHQRSGKERIFPELSTGDTIFILHDGVAESDPGKTGLYFILKLADGNENNIPTEVITQLQELDWLNKTDEQT